MRTPKLVLGDPHCSGNLWVGALRPAHKGGQHTVMAICATIALCLVPLPFGCFCIFAVMQYPHQVRLALAHLGRVIKTVLGQASV